MAKPKTPKKTPRPGRNGVTLPQAGNPGNSGGKKGRSGRKPQKLGLFLKELRESPDAQEKLRAVALDPTNRNFGNAWKLAADYDEDRPGQKHEHRFPDMPATERVNRVAEILNSAKERVKSTNGHANGNGSH